MGTRVAKLVRQGKMAPYKDATKAIKITVTKIDVLRGQEKKPDQCAMAKATCRLFPYALKTIVYPWGAYVETIDPKTMKKQTRRYIPSVEARKEIVGFDAKKGFAPGEYYFEAPTGSNTLLAQKKRSARRPRRHQPGDGTIKRRSHVLKQRRIKHAFAY